MKTSVQVGFLALACMFSVEAQDYIISTVAGGAPTVTPIAGAQASIGSPHGLAIDKAGNVFFTSLDCVWKLDLSGVLFRIAGNSRGGYSGDGGSATSAQLSNPTGLAVDVSGNIYIADTQNDRIRMVSMAGIITTIAGNGSYGYSGDGGPAIDAQLSYPTGIAVDASGNLYFTDVGVVRKISTAGIITTVAGNGSCCIYSGDGGPAIDAQLSFSKGIAVDGNGNLYIAQSYPDLILKVSSSGILTTVAGGGGDSNLGDGGPASGAQLNAPNGVSVDPSGDIYIADSGDFRVRKILTSRIITTVAGNGSRGYSGDGGSAVRAELSSPSGTVASAGNLYIADAGNDRIRKVSTNGTITTVAGNGSYGYAGDGGPAVDSQLSLTIPGGGDPDFSGVAVDAAGNLYIADSGNFRVRKISTAGIITTVAGNGSYGYSGDGGLAVNAELARPTGVAVDASGDLYISDPSTFTVRKVTADGIITTVAGNGSEGYSGDGGAAKDAQVNPNGVAVDARGNLYIADFVDCVIRKVSSAGVITTIAGGSYGYSGDGGPARNAQLDQPYGAAVDVSGNIYIADTGNERIRKISTTGIITTIAGNGSYGYTGDGGPATSATLSGPWGVFVDIRGNVYITDTTNNVIRLLTPSSSNCAYSLSQTSLQPPVDGGNVTLTITTDAGCAWTVTNLPDWVTVSGSSTASGTAAVILTVSPNTGPPRTAQISIAGISVTVSQGSDVLLVNAGGVVNGASYVGGAPVAPGSIAAVFGNFLLGSPLTDSGFPLPINLGGISLQFGSGTASPLFYASVGQINAQVPWELAGQSQITITAAFQGQTSASQTVNLATYAPGIFATNGEGTGQGAILDANYHLIDSTNPSTAGNVVQIFCTGLGPVTNQPATGAPAPGSPPAETTATPTVTIGGASAHVTFSGLAPGFVGLFQVNAQVPAAAANGSAVPVAIAIGGAASNMVSIAVQ